MIIYPGLEKKYNDWKNNNRDPYGACIFKFAEIWADLMESYINKGEKDLDIFVEKTSRIADDACGGITGLMYGAAVSLLAQTWIYGKALNDWHNKKYNYKGKSPEIEIISYDSY